MTRTTSGFAVAVAVAAMWACGGGTDERAESAGGSAAAGSGATAERRYTRQTFVLCPALEPYRAELAGIIGFEQDTSRDIALGRSECAIRGHGGSFARVSLAPAMLRTPEMVAEGIDGETSAVPSLGDDAVFIDGGRQPHVAFSMGPLVIDIDAEHGDAPSREDMVALATRVREILVNANQ